MDAVLFIGFALAMTIYLMYFDKNEKEEIEVVAEDTAREAKLNDDFYEDQNAFSLIINALGFPKGGDT